MSVLDPAPSGEAPAAESVDQLLAEAAAALGRDEPPEAILGRIAQAAGGVPLEAGAAIAIPRAGLVIAPGLHQSLIPSLETGPWLECLSSASPVLFGSVDEMPVHVAEMASSGGCEALWCVPVSEDRTVVAVLVLWRSSPGLPDDSQTVHLSRVGAVATAVMRLDRLDTELRHVRYHDRQTGLLNRDYLFSVLDESDIAGGAHLVVSLDDLGMVNERLGHRAADAVAVQAATRLTAAVRPSDIVVRFGGAAFVVVCQRPCDLPDSAAVADRALIALTEPYVAEGEVVEITASAGIVHDTGRDLVDELVARASTALAEARAAGGSRWRRAQD